MKSPALVPALAPALLFLSLLAAVPAQAKVSDDLTVVIIRHGEKPENGDNLSCQGEHRALQLPPVLFGKFNKPAFTYVPKLNQGKSTTHARMFQTVAPFAIAQNLTINSKFDEDAFSDVAKDVMGRSGTVLMVWEHSAIPTLAGALGVKNPPAWAGSDFDSIWIITYKSGKATLTQDTEGITPASSCSF